MGINYWESENATKMWKKFNAERVEEDFRLLKGAGVDYLRVFPLWSDFQPIQKQYAGCNSFYEMQIDGEATENTEAGRAGVSEKMIGHFETFCRLAKKYDLKLIVGLITGGMSFGVFVPPAFNGKSFIADAEAIRWQLKFVKYFVNHFKNQDCIVGWDLGNEPDGEGDGDKNKFFLWASTISNQIRVCDPERPVVTGLHKNRIENGDGNWIDASEYGDINTAHPYNCFELKSEPINSMLAVVNIPFSNMIRQDVAKMPAFIQEFGAIGYMICSKETEAAFYRGALLTSIAHNCNGAMWWCAFDQGELDFAPYNWNSIGSQYGFFDKDGKAKPIVKENLYVKELIAALPEDFPNFESDSTIVVQKENAGVSVYDYARTSFALAIAAGLTPRLCYANAEIPESGLYIFPNLVGFKTITKKNYDKLLGYVKEGATLYISLGDCIFREIPEVCGVTIDHRMCYGKKVEVEINGKEYTLDSNATYDCKATTAEVLVKDKNGSPIMFKNKYGKGFVYLCLLPLEKSVMENAGSFYKDDSVFGCEFYKLFAKDAPKKTVCGVDSDYVGLTEHIVDANERYVFAINYSMKDIKAKTDIPKDCKAIPVFGNAPD
ncbi:MAG: cellulase family glycosylhydrolase, partial [Clostridia bacterium]|nr:cellulase family glycosylhydrolase [Clostridia bacterium]